MSFIKSAIFQGLSWCILFSLIAAPAVQAQNSPLMAPVMTAPIVPVFIPIVTAPVLAQAANAPDSTTAPLVQAELDAKQNTSSPLWFGAGCLLGLIGVVLGFVIEPSPPVSALVGQSPEYAMAYTARYKEVGKRQQGKMAIIGCAITGVVSTVLYVVSAAATLAAY